MGDKDLPHFSDTDDDDEDEDEAAMQAALREMVKIPDIDSQHRHPTRGQRRPEERDEVWAHKLQKNPSPDKQQKWKKSKAQDMATQNSPRRAESSSSRVVKEEDKAKKRQSETWADRLKKTTQSEKVEKPKQQETRPDSSAPKEVGYWQIASPADLMEQNIKHPLMDQQLKMMRIEAAANPKSNRPTTRIIRHMASTQTPHKVAKTVATNTDAELETDSSVMKQQLEQPMGSSPRQAGLINILTVPFRTSLKVAPGKDEDLTTPQEQIPQSVQFKNLPVFGRNRVGSTAAVAKEVDKSLAPAPSSTSALAPTSSRLASTSNASRVITAAPDASSIVPSTPSSSATITPMTSEATLVIPTPALDIPAITNQVEATEVTTALTEDNPSSQEAEEIKSVAESLANAFKHLFLKAISGDHATFPPEKTETANATAAGAEAEADDSHTVILMPPETQNEVSEEMKEEKDRDAHALLENKSGQLKHSDSMQTLTIQGRRSQITTTYEDHCQREPQAGIDKNAARKLIIASILCIFFMTCEIIGGILSNSLAIATDAAHLLTDLAGFLISLFALYLAGRASTERFNFGWHRAEVIGAMISVYFIWVITGILVWIAVNRLLSDSHKVDAKIMLITSALAIVVNLIMAFQLSHGHFHSHRNSGIKVQPSEQNATENPISIMNPTGKDQHLMATSISANQTHQHRENINVRAAIIHVIGDFVQSVGVFLAAIVIFFKPEWAAIDSICTFFFSIIVVIVTFGILKEVMMVLMEATPDYMEYGEVQKVFLSIDGVERVHNLRIWALSIDKIALSAHLAIRKDADPHIILEQAKTLIHKRYHFYETTIQVEIYNEHDHNYDHLPNAPQGQPLKYPKDIGTDNPTQSLDDATKEKDQSNQMHSLANSSTNETLIETEINKKNDMNHDQQ